MSNGALIFAHNNQEIDYVKLANFAASRINAFLNVPVSIATDSKDWLLKQYPNHNFDQIIEVSNTVNNRKAFFDGTMFSKVLDWNNLTRNTAYSITPYDTTLVIDSDYIINSDVLKIAFDRDIPFQIYKNSFDLAGWRDKSPFERINSYSIPFYWATAFVFKKDPIVESFFDLITYIKSNWAYFRVLYNLNGSPFRNDYAFSIAIHIMNGKTNGEFAVELPGTMTYIQDKDILLTMSDGAMQFLVEKQNFLGEYIAAKTQNIDVHVMNKISLNRVIDEVANV
jgi:hypothetical protein